MDDESGDSMEPTEAVPPIGLGESELQRDSCVVDGEKPGVDSSDEGSILEGTTRDKDQGSPVSIANNRGRIRTFPWKICRGRSKLLAR